MVDVTDDGNLTSSYHWVPTSYFGARRAGGLPKPQVSSYHTHNVDKIGDVADGNGVVAAAGNVDATLLPGQPRRIPRGRPHGGGGCSHHLWAQVLGGAVINFLVNLSKTRDIISVNERKADGATRCGSCGADPLSKTDTMRRQKKTALGLGSSPNCRKRRIPLRNGS